MNPSRTIGVPSPLGNPGLASQSQALTGSQFPDQTQASDDQRGPVLSQTATQQTQAQAAYAQFQGQLQSPQPHLRTQQHKTPNTAAAQQHKTPNTAAAQQHKTPNTAAATPVPGSSPTPPSSSGGSARRSQQRPPNKHSGASNASSGSPMKTMELAPAPRKRKKKVQEMTIPDKVSSLLPECELYTRLLKLEKRIDCCLSRKKTDILEYLRNPPHFRKTLRIYVFNTCDNQNQMDVDESSEKHEKESAPPPSWTLKIIGKIVEDGGAEVNHSTTLGDEAVDSPHHHNYPKFSSFFKRITIYLDQSLYPDDHVITWEKSRSQALREGFKVKRNGNKEFAAIIRLEMNHTPERFKLSPALTQVLGMEVETKPRVLNALWQYIKNKKLQDLNDPSYFTCDAPLRKVFFDDKVRFAVASLKLSQHLTPLQPIQIQHEIKLSAGPCGSTCYEVVVDVPYPSVEKDMSNCLASVEDQKEIDAYDQTIVAAVKKLGERSKRRAFFLGFSKSPAEFINVLIGSQNRDLKTIAGDASLNTEKEQSSEFFNQSWTEDAVVQYLNRKPSMGGANSGRSNAGAAQ